MLSIFGLRSLDWAIISLSLFNMIVLLWLGLTVLLNAERRTVGTWVASCGLILCGLFFVGHTAVVGRRIGTFDGEIGFWWRASWLLTISAPFLWYLGTIWYAGVLQSYWHRLGLTAATLLGGLALLLLLQNPLPSYQDVAARAPIELVNIAGIPAVAVAYPLYSILCIGLAIAALYHPKASARFMGDLARQRARPWLVAASTMIVLISVVFGVIMAWFLNHVEARPEALFFLRHLPLFMAFDLLLQVLVALGLLLTGQAIVSYEIFTGKTLPRRGLRRYWRRCLILAAGYGALVGLSLSLPHISTIYRVLVATAVMTLFYALLSWRSYAEREESMDRLRPFVASQRLYERLVRPLAETSDAQPDVDIEAPFKALCTDVLDAQTAFLAALGPLAPLVGPALAHPEDAPRPALSSLIAQLQSPQTMCLELDGIRYGGAVWAVPLWSERGLIGVLLLGPKRDGGLYTQEEIELARATGERLLDTQASAELARRLMALQRQRLAEHHVIDNRARRKLHDDVLPRLHTAMLLLGTGPRTHVNCERECGGDSLTPDGQDDVLAILADVHRQIANLLHAIPPTPTSTGGHQGVLAALRHTVEGELGNAFDNVSWQIEPTAAKVAAQLPAITTEVLMFAAREAIRNAARYGRNGDGARPLHLCLAMRWRDGLEIVVEDDGVGLDRTVRLAESQAAGAGHGLALHGTMMAVLGGTLTTESIPAAFTRVTLTLPRHVCEQALEAAALP